MKTKWNLTKSEQIAHSANSARLRAAGVAIGVESTASSEPPLLRIDQNGDGIICAGTRAGIEIAVWVRFTILKSQITIRDCEIDIPGWDGVNIFLVEPSEDSLSCKAFGWLDLRDGAALNHQIFSERPLSRGMNLEGFVIAQSFDPLASQFKTGMTIDAKMWLSDQFDNFYTSVLKLRVERRSQKRFHARSGPGLFGPEKVIEPAPTTVGRAGTVPVGHLKPLPGDEE